MSLIWALQWTRWLTALAVVLQTLELLEIKNLVRKFWPWEILREEYPRPLRPFLRLLLGDRQFPYLLWLRLLAAMALLFHSSLGVLLVLLATSYLINLRWQ